MGKKNEIEKSPRKKVAKKTYKLWVTIEEHIVYEDGSDEYRDIEEDTVSAGEFSQIQAARLRMDLVSETFGGDFTEE